MAYKILIGKAHLSTQTYDKRKAKQLHKHLTHTYEGLKVDIRDEEGRRCDLSNPEV